VAFTVEDVVARLEDAGVRLDRGMTEADLKRVEKKFGFAFGPDHRALLRTALPLGDTWLNWRHATAVKIRERLQAPIDEIVFAVLTEGFWPPAWGARPADDSTAERTARERLAGVPVLVPLYGHRYLPAAPAPEGSPVFSVQRGAVTVHSDLLEFVEVEFGAAPPANTTPPGGPGLEFWSDLAV
jgi:hypothetical protein